MSSPRAVLNGRVRDGESVHGECAMASPQAWQAAVDADQGAAESTWM
jgi:hypothetical protein